MQLRLPSPNDLRNPMGTHISIRGPYLKEDQVDAFSELLWGFGCPPRAAMKALQSLTYSGRYDCVVVTRAFADLREQLAPFGYVLETWKPA